MTRLQRWKKLIENEGYHLEYKEYENWGQVPHAIRDSTEIPLAISDEKGNIITADKIIANIKNFRILKRAYEQSQSIYIPEFDVLVRKVNKDLYDLDVFFYF